MGRDLLTDFELMILLAILRAGDEAYGVAIAREIEETAGRAAMLGAVYAALDRLERNGLVASIVGEPTAARGGRAKRFFRVTPGAWWLIATGAAAGLMLAVVLVAVTRRRMLRDDGVVRPILPR